MGKLNEIAKSFCYRDYLMGFFSRIFLLDASTIVMVCLSEWMFFFSLFVYCDTYFYRSTTVYDELVQSCCVIMNLHFIFTHNQYIYIGYIFTMHNKNENTNNIVHTFFSIPHTNEMDSGFQAFKLWHSFPVMKFDFFCYIFFDVVFEWKKFYIFGTQIKIKYTLE